MKRTSFVNGCLQCLVLLCSAGLALLALGTATAVPAEAAPLAAGVPLVAPADAPAAFLLPLVAELGHVLLMTAGYLLLLWYEFRRPARWARRFAHFALLFAALSGGVLFVCHHG